jgi:ubiquinone/menaquinone biosynthesis C-methylase UbiE
MEIIAIKKAFTSLQNPSVLEIGGGYGNFCYMFNHILGYKDYTLLDTKSMLRLAKKFHEITQIQCNYVPTEDYMSLKGKEFDLLVANVCLSEIPCQHVLNILECVAENCDRFFIIDAGIEEGINLKKIFGYLHKHFRIEQATDFLSLQKNSFIYYGRNKNV